MVLRTQVRGTHRRIFAIVGAVASMALIVALAHSAGRREPRFMDAAVVTSGSSFGLSGTVGNLTPGITTRLELTVTSRMSRRITVRSVTIGMKAVPADCPAANLSINDADFTGSLPTVTITGLSVKVPPRATAKLSLRMRLARGAANGCQHARFPLRYSGTATEGRLGTASTR